MTRKTGRTKTRMGEGWRESPPAAPRSIGVLEADSEDVGYPNAGLVLGERIGASPVVLHPFRNESEVVGGSPEVAWLRELRVRREALKRSFDAVDGVAAS